jgi:acylphosphatase
MIEGVKGWVKNLDDNRVEAVFEGEETAVDALVVFCREGPKAAQITDVVVEWGPYTGEFDTFSIVY